MRFCFGVFSLKLNYYFLRVLRSVGFELDNKQNKSCHNALKKQRFLLI